MSEPESGAGGDAVNPGMADDYRIAWLKGRVLKGLGLKKEHHFDDLLQRNGAETAKDLLCYLDNPIEKDRGALLFYSHVLEVEEEVEIVEGMYMTGKWHATVIACCALNS